MRMYVAWESCTSELAWIASGLMMAIMSLRHILKTQVSMNQNQCCMNRGKGVYQGSDERRDAHIGESRRDWTPYIRANQEPRYRLAMLGNQTGESLRSKGFQVRKIRISHLPTRHTQPFSNTVVLGLYMFIRLWRLALSPHAELLIPRSGNPLHQYQEHTVCLLGLMARKGT